MTLILQLLHPGIKSVELNSPLYTCVEHATIRLFHVEEFGKYLVRSDIGLYPECDQLMLTTALTFCVYITSIFNYVVQLLNHSTESYVCRTANAEYGRKNS